MRTHRCLLALAALAGACAHQAPCIRAPVPVGQEIPAPARFEADVVGRYDHDSSSYVEGLASYGGVLYESTGRAGQSGVRVVELDRDRDHNPPREVWALPGSNFGEGFAVRGHLLYQLTWFQHRVFVWDLNAAGPQRVPAQRGYPDFGWGMEYLPDSDRFLTTNGTATMSWRDPETMDAVSTVQVIRENRTVCNLNELAVVGTDAWVNIFGTDEAVRVRLADGHVTGVVDLGHIAFSERGANRPDFETNGIAWLPARGHFLITGKQWNHSYEVALHEIVP